MKIIIFSPNYSSDSGGIIVLHKLCDILINLGYDAGFYINENEEFHVNSSYKSQVYTISDIDVEKDLIIYPEIINGNPLGGKNIVRYIMNIGHIALDRKSTWGDNDHWIYYSERFYDGLKPKNILTISDSKLEYYKDYGIERNINDCFTYRKQHDNVANITKYHSEDAIEIPFNCGDEYLITIFNSCKNFYCYDTESHLSVLAGLCGCNSIIISQNKTKEEIIDKQPPLKYGVAFGIGDIERSIQTRTLLRLYMVQAEDLQIVKVLEYFTNILKISPINENSYILQTL